MNPIETFLPTSIVKRKDPEAFDHLMECSGTFSIEGAEFALAGDNRVKFRRFVKQDIDTDTGKAIGNRIDAWDGDHPLEPEVYARLSSLFS